MVNEESDNEFFTCDLKTLAAWVKLDRENYTL